MAAIDALAVFGVSLFLLASCVVFYRSARKRSTRPLSKREKEKVWQEFLRKKDGR